MKKLLMMIGAAAVAVATVAKADTNITESVSLAVDADWSDRGKVILHHGVTLDLNGHSLKVADFGATPFAHVTNETGVVAGYKDLEFIEATGTQNITTDVKPASTDRFVARLRLNATGTTQSYISARGGSSSTRMEIMQSSSKLNIYYGNTSTAVLTGPSAVAEKDYDVDVDFGQGTCSVSSDSGSKSGTFTSQSFTPGGNFQFFRNSGGNNAQCRLYFFKVYGSDGNLKFDFSPVVRASDGAIGLYERVNGNFYGAAAGTFNDDAETEITNSASGDPAEFTVSIPAGYRALEYIEATGKQRIETDYTPQSNDCAKALVEFTNSSNQYVLCARQSSSEKMFGFGYVNGLKFYYNNGSTTAKTLSMDTPYDIVMNDYETTGECRYDSTVAGTLTQANFTPPATATLFASYTYNNGSKTGWGNYAKCKFYSLSIYDKDGVLQRNYVPAYGEAEKAAGLYETATGTFYQSATATGFTSYGETGDYITPVPTNASVDITGNLKFVKEGGGTFVAAKAGTSYSGGTLVKGGTLVAGAAWNTMIFGADGSEVEVSATGGIPAVLDVNGQYAGGYMLVLNGGTVVNSGLGLSASYSGIAKMRLEEDSALSFANSYPISAQGSLCSIDLGGKTLSVENSASKIAFFRNVLATNGTIAVDSGVLAFLSNASDLREATLRVGEEAHIYATIAGTKLGDYIVDATSGNSDSTTNVAVYGTFKPNTDYFIGCEIQDGATIDCSGRTTPLPIVGLNTSANSKAISFAPGATVGVRIGARKKLQSTPVITWTASEKPDPSVKFVRADADRRYSLVVKDDGLYYVGPGTTIIFY